MGEPADTGHPVAQWQGPALRRPLWPKPAIPLLAAVMAAVLAGCTQNVNEKRDAHGRMQLHRVAETGDVAAVEALLLEGAAVNVRDLDGVTPLHRAARDGDRAMVECLVRYHADLAMKTKDGWDALLLAAMKGHVDIVKLLLSYGAPAAPRTPEGWSLLHLAALKDNVDLAEACQLNWPGYEEAGKPSLDESDKQGNTPLMLALQRGHIEMVEYFLAKGADPDTTDAQGDTLLHHLIAAGNSELASRLVMFYKADVNRPNKAGQTPYAAATANENKELAKLLWDSGGR